MSRNDWTRLICFVRERPVSSCMLRVEMFSLITPFRFATESHHSQLEAQVVKKQGLD
jgi:hypothetical protein